MFNDEENNLNGETDKLENGESVSEAEKLEHTDSDIIQTLKAEIEDYKDRLARSMAETENTRTRLNKKIEETKEYAITNFATDFISTIDNFYRALSHKPDISNNEEFKNFVEGIEMIKNDLANMLKKNHVVIVDPKIHDQFDYKLHQAVSRIPTNDFEEGSVVNVIQVGYTLRERLLRAAMVTVACKNDA